MELLPTYLSVIENLIISVLTGSSIMAVISYGIVMKFGYPQKEFGVYMSRSIYILLRIGHIALAALVILSFLVFGLLDQILEAKVEYGIKLLVVLVNFAFLYLINFKGKSIHRYIPLVAGGWLFVGIFHSYSNFAVITSFVSSLFFYILFLIGGHFLFVQLRKIKKAKVASDK